MKPWFLRCMFIRQYRMQKEIKKLRWVINSLQTVRSTQFEADVELNP